MIRDKVSVALITDSVLTNRAIATCVDETRFEMQSLASDDPRLMDELLYRNPQIIFVRHVLKQGDGFQVCDRIKHENALRHAKIIFLSQDESNRERAFQHRASHFLKIPFSTEKTAALMQEFVASKPTILFVDDSKLAHHTVVPKIAAEEFRVIEAWDGQEALDIIRNQPIDLLITDLEMPVMDGFTLCRHVKSLDNQAQIPVLVSSSLDSDEEVRRGFEAGADDYVVKPVVPAELISRIRRLLPGAGPRRMEKILVVDDSKILRQMITQALEAQGLQIDQAADGKEGLRKASSGHYHLLITDYEMPDINGYELCMQIRQDQDIAELPIVMVSSRESTADQVRVRSTGIQAYLTKPFKVERLVAEVERVLAESRLRRQQKSMRLYLSDSAAQAVDRLSENSGGFACTAHDEFRTVFFSDICGFTSLCETRSALEIVGLLNAYFDRMVEILIKYDAVIDKFIGDAIMALFDQEGDGAHRAVCAAWEMLQTLPAIREKSGIALHIRIGLNSGYVVVGDIGSRQRRDFTAIGDNVNVCQRFESNAEPDGILISDSTYDLVKHVVQAELREDIHLKGKAEPVRGYQIRSVMPYSLLENRP